MFDSMFNPPRVIVGEAIIVSACVVAQQADHL